MMRRSFLRATVAGVLAAAIFYPTIGGSAGITVFPLPPKNVSKPGASKVLKKSSDQDLKLHGVKLGEIFDEGKVDPAKSLAQFLDQVRSEVWIVPATIPGDMAPAPGGGGMTPSQVRERLISQARESAKDSKVVDLTKENFQTEVLESPIPVFIDVGAIWCNPCLIIEPVIQDLARQYEGQIKFAKIDVDTQGDLVHGLGVKTLPAFFGYVGGQQMFQGASVPLNSREEIKKYLIEQYLNRLTLSPSSK